MVTPTKKYQTVDGRSVINIHIIPKNSAGHRVTYPVKGTIVTKTRKRTTYSYEIWSIDGINDVVWGKNNHLNLVELGE